MPTRSKAQAKTTKNGVANLLPTKAGALRGNTNSKVRAKARRADDDEDEDASEEELKESGNSGEEYQQSEPESDDAKSLDSEALDEDDEFDSAPRKRKRGSAASTPAKKKARPAARRASSSPRKRRTVSQDSEEELELAEGQEVVGRVVQAPKTGRVPPGQISQNTFNFLLELKKPECNDREWFKLQEPVYRLAEKEWKDFIDSFTDVLVEVDPEIPPLPPKDVIHRIYRDVRFSNDKTPYKTGFSASFSRSGRKGKFAHYHISVRPGHQSIIAAGVWCPDKNELATIRAHIKRSPARIRSVLAEKEFSSFFGAPRPHPKGERQSIFGNDDQLKTAPKGVDKNHKDIDLLKCRSFAVIHRFTDAEVLDPNFKETLGRVATVMRPFVHCLNDMMTLPPDSDESAAESDNDDDAGDADED